MKDFQDHLWEIFLTLGRNKLRTLLTGFAVAWGVLLLILLLGVSTGIQSGMIHNIRQEGSSQSSIHLYLWSTSMPYKGHPEGRSLYFSSTQELQRIFQGIPAIEAYYPTLIGYFPVSTPKSEVNLSVEGVDQDYFQKISSLQILQGRGILSSDNSQKQKVILIDKTTADRLFDTPDIVGRQVSLLHSIYTVVGVYKNSGKSGMAYIPFSSFSIQFPQFLRTIYQVSLYCPSVTTEEQLKSLQATLNQRIALLKECDPQDPNLIYLDSRMQTEKQVNKVMHGLELFMWIMGISTLMIGIVGVTNIMLVSVQERMAEIGIRKALGARPRNIIQMIVSESVIITLISGLIGLVVAVALLALLSYGIETSGIGQRSIGDEHFMIFKDPVIRPSLAIGTLFLMVLSGALAGFFPARKAIQIPAIEAMRK